MLNKKLAGLFMVPALLMGINASNAASTSATQTLQATLDTYLDITALTAGAVTSTSITPETGNLAAQLISKFKVTTNSDTQALFLQASTKGAGGDVNAMFKQGSLVYVIFSNIDSTKRPSSSAIDDCKSASPTAANNPNAIAYPISSIDFDNGGSYTYDDTKNQYNITVNTGEVIATTKTGVAPYTNTYSFVDTAGTYQAIMTLTTTSL